MSDPLRSLTKIQNELNANRLEQGQVKAEIDDQTQKLNTAEATARKLRQALSGRRDSNVIELRERLVPIAVITFPENEILQQQFIESSIAGFLVAHKNDALSLEFKLSTADADRVMLAQSLEDLRIRLIRLQKQESRTTRKLSPLLDMARQSLSKLKESIDESSAIEETNQEVAGSDSGEEISRDFAEGTAETLQASA